MLTDEMRTYGIHKAAPLPLLAVRMSIPPFHQITLTLQCPNASKTRCMRPNSLCGSRRACCVVVVIAIALACAVLPGPLAERVPGGPQPVAQPTRSRSRASETWHPSQLMLSSTGLWELMLSSTDADARYQALLGFEGSSLSGGV